MLQAYEPTSAQAREAYTLVVAHILDTASIWQQTLSVGRRAIRSRLWSANREPSSAHNGPLHPIMAVALLKM